MFNLLLSQDQPATLINMIHDLKTGVNMDGKKNSIIWKPNRYEADRFLANRPVFLFFISVTSILFCVFSNYS